MLKEISPDELREDGWPVTPSSSPDQRGLCCPRTTCYVVAAPVVLVTSLVTATLGCFVNCIAGTASPNLERGVLLKDKKPEDQEESATSLGNRSFTCIENILTWNSLLYKKLQPGQP